MQSFKGLLHEKEYGFCRGGSPLERGSEQHMTDFDRAVRDINIQEGDNPNWSRFSGGRCLAFVLVRAMDGVP